MRLEEKEDVQKSGSIWPQASVDLTFGHLFNLWKQHEIENQSMRLPTGSFTSSFFLSPVGDGKRKGREGETGNRLLTRLFRGNLSPEIISLSLWKLSPRRLWAAASASKDRRWETDLDSLFLFK